MPVQLAYGALLQVLLCGCDVVALRQIIVDLLADPATREILVFESENRHLRFGTVPESVLC